MNIENLSSAYKKLDMTGKVGFMCFYAHCCDSTGNFLCSIVDLVLEF